MIFENYADMPLSENLILYLHNQLLKYSDKDERHKGNYKNLENQVQMTDASGKVLGVLFDTTPAYLKVKLDPLAPIDGRNHWRLRVTVPKGSVYTAIPEGSAVVLTTGGTNPRRLRIPIRGIAYDRGGVGPKL